MCLTYGERRRLRTLARLCINGKAGGRQRCAPTAADCTASPASQAAASQRWGIHSVSCPFFQSWCINQLAELCNIWRSVTLALFYFQQRGWMGISPIQRHFCVSTTLPFTFRGQLCLFPAPSHTPTTHPRASVLPPGVFSLED